MGVLKRIAELWLGVEPAKPGEGSVWRFLIHKPWPGWLPNWLAILLLVLLAFIVISIYRRDAVRVPRLRRVALIGLRTLLICVALLCLTTVSVAIDRTSLPDVVVLIDASASMGVDDAYESSDDKAIAKSAAKNEAPPQRLDIARKILTHDDGEFLTKLQQRFRLRCYAFGEAASPIGRSDNSADDGLSNLLQQLESLEATHPVTRPGPALRELSNEFRGQPPAAIVMLTDGVASVSEQDRVTHVAQDLASQVIPVFVVGIGSDDPGRDLQLYDVLLDEIAIVDDPVIISGQVRSFGFERKDVEAVVKDNATDEVLASTVIQTGPAGKPTPVEISWTPKVEGEFDLSIELATLPGESNSANNTSVRHVSVREGRIRVLLLERIPRWEFRYVKAWFEREAADSRSIQIDSILFDADPEYAALDRSARELNGRFPVNRDRLFEYDVIIIGDIDPGFLSSRSQENLRDFVREKGGGIVLIGGADYNPIAWRNTPLESLVPVDIASVRVPGEGDATRLFPARKTVTGDRSVSVLRFADGEAEQERVWNSLAPLGWMLEARRLAPGAVSLVEHPNRLGDDGLLPVIVQHQYGAGKVVFHATDELWRWRKNAGDLYYGRYWTQLVRHLSRANLLGRDRTAELMSDRLVYKAGESILLRARFPGVNDAEQLPQNVSVVLERRDGARQTVVLESAAAGGQVFEARCRPGLGAYHAWIETPSFPDAAPSTDFRVEVPQLELQNRALARSDLKLLAEKTHGQFYSPGSAARIPNDLPTGRAVTLDSQVVIPLWNRWELAILFVGLLTTEWIFRKRCRLI